jgi:hypothetical protein
VDMGMIGQPAIAPGSAARALNRTPVGASSAPVSRTVTERFSIPPESLKSSDRTPAEVGRSVGSFVGTTVTVTTSSSGLYIFTVNGSADNVATTKRKLIERLVKPVRAGRASHRQRKGGRAHTHTALVACRG